MREFSSEQQLLHKFIIATGQVIDNGILHGQMGATILFYEYSRKTGNTIFSDYGSVLLDKIWNTIDKQTSINFENGLCGIGWATEYLIQNNFVEGIGAEVCEDINERIMKFDPRRIKDYSLENGLCGILHYVLIHIKGCQNQDVSLGFDDIYIKDMFDAINSIPLGQTENDMSDLIATFNGFYKTKQCKYIYSLESFIKKTSDIQTNNSIGLRSIYRNQLMEVLSAKEVSIL